MWGWMVVAFCAVAAITQLEAELADRLQRLLRELRVRLRERLVEHQLRENRSVVGTFGTSEVEAQRTGEGKPVSFSSSPYTRDVIVAGP
jgi:hypothetical protein